VRPRRLRSADAETESTVRVAAGRCQEGERGSCRGAEAQECSADAAPVANPPPASFTESSNSTVSSLAVAPADDLLPNAASAAATEAAPDGAAPAEPRTGQKRKAPFSPDVCRKLLARARYCALHACADAHGRTTDCAAGPPAAAAAASAASAAPIEPSTAFCQAARAGRIFVTRTRCASGCYR
jgi:hypothetical protein